jgi:1-acyl-sn-glycerol-3-phosphate acyltransferase
MTVSTTMHPLRAVLPAVVYWPYRALRTVLTALCFAGFWTAVVIVGWLWLPIAWTWPGDRPAKIRRMHRVARAGFAGFHAVMAAFRLYRRTSPVRTVRPGDSPVVLIANHPTLCDVTSIISWFPNVVAIARPGFADHPLIAPVVRACGFVSTGSRVLRDGEERLRMGFDVLVFPEGTRTPLDGPPNPFHRGAFELAARAGVPIVLLKLTCEPPALSKRLPIWKIADHTAVLTIEPIEVVAPPRAGDRAHGSREMCRAIEQRYRVLLGYSSTSGEGA